MFVHVSVESISKAQLLKQISHKDMIETVERLFTAFPISHKRVPPPTATYSRLPLAAGWAGWAGGNPCVNHSKKNEIENRIDNRSQLVITVN